MQRTSEAMNQRLKLGYLLTALVALSIFALGLLGLHTLKSDLTAFQLKEKLQAETMLNELDKAIFQLITTQKDKLKKVIEKNYTTSTHLNLQSFICSFGETCQDLTNKAPVSLLVTFNAAGDQLYPPKESTSQFYQQALTLKNIAVTLTTTRDQLNKIPLMARIEGIWSSYLTQNGHNLLICWLGRNNITFCAAPDRTWLINQVSSLLKGRFSANSPNHIRLIDVHQDIIWQNRPPQTKQISAMRQLSSPLYFWHLEALKTSSTIPYQYPFTLLALTIPTICLLFIIAIALFKNQKKALEEANNRANFAASIAHELKTPLTNLQLYADLLLNKNAQAGDKTQESETESSNETSDEISKYTRVIAAETTRLSELVNNALTISKSSQLGHKHPAGQSAMKRQTTKASPDKIIEQTITRLTPLLGEQIKNITYDLKTSEEVMIDKSALEQILVNLLDNARKYADGKPIHIHSSFEENHFKLIVQDEGTSLTQSDLHQIFTPFHQNTKSKNIKEGVGLGLAVCQQLVKENDGTIKAELANPGTSINATSFIATLKIERLQNEKGHLKGTGQ